MIKGLIDIDSEKPDQKSKIVFVTLKKRLDTCSFAGGKRRLREIIVAPPNNIVKVENIFYIRFSKSTFL